MLPNMTKLIFHTPMYCFVMFLLDVIEHFFMINNKNLLVYSDFKHVIIVVNISQIEILRYFVVKLFSILPDIKLKL